MKAETIAWSKLELKDPVTFRDNGRPFIIRHLKNVKGRIMCEYEMDDDKVMAPIEKLTNKVQGLIKKRIIAKA